MSSRDAILQRIRTELARNPAGADDAAPPVADVWPQTHPAAENMAARFTAELSAIDGEVFACGSMDEARAKLAELLAGLPSPRVGAVDRPVCRELLSGAGAADVTWAKEGWPPREIAELEAGVVAAEWLLADTGSCVIVSGTPEERLMCYLPPVCVVVGRVEQLAENLPAAWAQIARQAADPNRRGEFVIVTGPSRTADIEKILILGVHGPKRLIVLLVG